MHTEVESGVTDAERSHKDQLARLPCVACYVILDRVHRCEHLHHIEWARGDETAFLMLPLCEEMHEGSGGMHNLSRRGFENRYKTSQLELLAETYRMLEEQRRGTLSRYLKGRSY